MEVAKESWSVRDARTRFSELLDTCQTMGPQIISRCGVPTAIIVSVELWDEVSTQPMTLKGLLLSDDVRFTLDLPDQEETRHRQVSDV